MSSSQHASFENTAIVVAAKNEESNIKDCVQSILNATGGKVEIIVVDDGSTDQTPQLLLRFQNQIRVITTNGLGPALARNIAVSKTQKDFIAFADADCVVRPDWLTNLVGEFSKADTTYVAIGGAQLTHPHANHWDRFHSKFMERMGFISDYIHQNQDIREVNHNPTCNVLYQRAVLEEIGGFDDELWPCEDLDLDIRLKKKGYRLLFTPLAKIEHHRPDSFRKFMKMMFRYGFGHAQLIKKHGPCQKIHVVPIVILVTFLMIFFPGLVFQVGYFYMTLFLLLYFYIGFRAKSFGKSFLYCLYLIPTVLSWNLGFFMGLFQKKKIARK